MESKAKKFLDETFKIINTLHKNDKSEVSLVLNQSDNEIYVMKCVALVNLPYQKLKHISHPALTEIFYVFEDDRKTYIVEEYIKGVNLNTLLNDKDCLLENQVIDIVLQLCSCLKLLHENNIIHRDIKPSNIVLMSDARIKLIDFDAARIGTDNKHKDTQLLGTQGYAPPEQYGFAQTDQRSDIYALGITMRELLGEKYNGLLSDIIIRCTKIDPEQRIASIKELERILKKRTLLFYHKCIIIFIGILLIFCGIYFWKIWQEGNINIPQESRIKNEVEPVQKEPEKEGNLETKETKSKSINNLETAIMKGKISSSETQIIPASKIKLTGQDWNIFKRRDDLYNNVFLTDKQKELLKIIPNSFFIAKDVGAADMLVVENLSEEDLVNLSIKVEFTDLLIDNISKDFNDPPDARCIYEYKGIDEKTGLYSSVICMRMGILKSKKSRGIIFEFSNSLVIGTNPSVKVTFSSENSESFVLENKIEITS